MADGEGGVKSCVLLNRVNCIGMAGRGDECGDGGGAKEVKKNFQCLLLI